MPVKIARSAPRASFGLPELLTPRVSLATRPEKREYSRQFGSHPGNPGLIGSLVGDVGALYDQNQHLGSDARIHGVARR
jgi:hypothetical protein